MISDEMRNKGGPAVNANMGKKEEKKAGMFQSNFLRGKLGALSTPTMQFIVLSILLFVGIFATYAFLYGLDALYPRAIWLIILGIVLLAIGWMLAVSSFILSILLLYILYYMYKGVIPINWVTVLIVIVLIIVIIIVSILAYISILIGSVLTAIGLASKYLGEAVFSDGIIDNVTGVLFVLAIAMVVIYSLYKEAKIGGGMILGFIIGAIVGWKLNLAVVLGAVFLMAFSLIVPTYYTQPKEPGLSAKLGKSCRDHSSEYFDIGTLMLMCALLLPFFIGIGGQINNNLLEIDEPEAAIYEIQYLNIPLLAVAAVFITVGLAFGIHKCNISPERCPTDAIPKRGDWPNARNDLRKKERFSSADRHWAADVAEQEMPDTEPEKPADNLSPDCWVNCSICNGRMKNKNLEKHIRKKHGEEFL